MRTVVWFRLKDLRVTDHLPLRDAALAGEVIPLFVLEPRSFAPEAAREMPYRTQFLVEALHALQANLLRRGSRLIVVAGESIEVVPRLADEWKADRVAAHSTVEPPDREHDRAFREVLGPRLALYAGETLLPPGTLRTRSGTPYSVFTRFARAFMEVGVTADPLAAPRDLGPVPADVRTRTAALPTCESLGITANPAVLAGSEQAAQDRLRSFLREKLAEYPRHRDRMDLAGTSRLSADLGCGTVSVRQVWNEAEKAAGSPGIARPFLNEILWREFAYDVLWHRPEVLERPFRPGFAGFPWSRDVELWKAWVLGQTGYPVVDASARQLIGEGFVHNRARMISASFLTKHLLVDYRLGEAHYRKYLTDFDPANNNLGWQWSAGCGCDAQPYFRIFHPVIQGEKFDPEGDYVRRWVPELARMPARYIHRPWEAPESVLREAGVRLDKDYPRPIVDHRFARERFLDLTAKHLKRGGK